VVIETNRHYLRSPVACLVGNRLGYRIAFPQGEPIALSIDEGEIVSRLFEHLCQPISGDRLLALLGGNVDRAAPLFSKLLARGAVLEGDASVLFGLSGGLPSGFVRPCARLVLGMTGAVFTMTMPAIVRRLQERFADHIDVVLTKSAKRFIQADALRSTGVTVRTNVFGGELHIDLAKRARLVLVMPASARTIARLAQGSCSDLLSLVCMATAAPVVVVPSMNARMWRHPAVARNVARVRGDGIQVLEPSIGFEVSEPNAPPGFGGPGLNLVNVEGVLSSILKEA
jgi:3-polyprenyl-4-hydroxybenzoate decarboxylase